MITRKNFVRESSNFHRLKNMSSREILCNINVIIIYVYSQSNFPATFKIKINKKFAGPSFSPWAEMSTVINSTLFIKFKRFSICSVYAVFKSFFRAKIIYKK